MYSRLTTGFHIPRATGLYFYSSGKSFTAIHPAKIEGTVHGFHPQRRERSTRRSASNLGAIAVLCTPLLLTANGARAERAFVRVNQLGYETEADSRAYLMAPGSASGGVFQVLNSKGLAFFSSASGANLGAWGAFSIYALDFSLSDVGTFRIDVDGRTLQALPTSKLTRPRGSIRKALRTRSTFTLTSATAHSLSRRRCGLLQLTFTMQLPPSSTRRNSTARILSLVI